MNKGLKRKWIAALLSGRYTQGRRALQDKFGRNCCLGVLCRVLGLEQREAPTNRGIIPGIGFVRQGVWFNTVLDRSLRDELGISLTQMNTLIEMNDDRKRSFMEIAEWIKKHL